MKVLWLGQDGAGVGVCRRMREKKNDVLFMCRKEGERGEGIIESKNYNYTSININAALKHFSPDIIIIDRVLPDDLFIGAHNYKIVGAKQSQYEVLGKDGLLKELKLTPTFEGGGWFNGNAFILLYSSQSYTRLCNDDVGPQVESMGAIVKLIHPSSPIGKELNKLTPLLTSLNFRGHIKVIGDKVKVDVGYDILYALSELINFKLLELFNCCANGVKFEHQMRTDIGATIKVLTPASQTIQLNELALKHTWERELKLTNEGYEVVGECPLSVSAIGDIKSCVGRCYRSIRMLNIKDGVYRTDVGKNVRVSML